MTAGPSTIPDRAVPAEPGDEELGLTELMRACLNRRARDDDPATWKHRLVTRLLVKADEGDLKAIQEIWTRLEGKPGTAGGEGPDDLNVTEELSVTILSAVDEVKARRDDDEHEDGGGDGDGDEPEHDG